MRRNQKWINFFFWGNILLGLILPIVTMIAVEIILNYVKLFDAIRSAVSLFSSDYIELVFHSIPFIIVSFLMKSRLHERPNSPDPYILRLTKIIGACGVLFIFSLWINLEVWISLARKSPGFSSGSLVYFFFPIYGIIAIFCGYGCGWFLGVIILGVRKKSGTSENFK